MCRPANRFNMRILPTLARWHIWLGWLIAVPLLLWTASGLFLVSFPIEQVRGTDLRAEPLPLPQGVAIRPPTIDGWPATHVELLSRTDGPVWIVHRTGGAMLAQNALTGEQLPAIDAPLLAVSAMLR